MEYIAQYFISVVSVLGGKDCSDRKGSESNISKGLEEWGEEHCPLLSSAGMSPDLRERNRGLYCPMPLITGLLGPPFCPFLSVNCMNSNTLSVLKCVE